MADPVAPEGGVRCWKELIDAFNHTIAAGNCMAESIRIAGSPFGSGTLPTESQRDEFLTACDAVAKVAASIQAYVSGE